jgi:membrane-associated phospholipid phosphatase
VVVGARRVGGDGAGGDRRRDPAALRLVATIVVGRLLVEGLKLIVQRPRPPVVDRLELVTSWSFPSSHSAGTMMTALAFALLAGGRWPALAAALLVAGVIGWSRVALAVHWPSDVLAGWGLGMMWVGLAILLKAPPPSPAGGLKITACWSVPAQS